MTLRTGLPLWRMAALLPLFGPALMAADAPPKIAPPPPAGPAMADANQAEPDRAAARFAAQKGLVPVPPPPAAPLDGDAGAARPAAVAATRTTVKITIKRDNAEAVIEVPADVFADDELKEMIANYLPKPDPNAVQLRVYNLRKMGIDLPAEAMEKLIRKAAKGPEEEQAELSITFDEPSRLYLISSWDPFHLARIDLLMNALAKDAEVQRGVFMMQPPGGGPGAMGGPGGLGGQGVMPGRPGVPFQPGPGGPGVAGGPGGGGDGADAEMQRRMQMEKDAALKQKLEGERQRDDKQRKEGRGQGQGRDPKDGGKPDGVPPAPVPPGHDEQF